MSHEDLASVWAALHDLQDIDCVIRGLIGSYTLDCLLFENDRSRLEECTLQYIASLQLIFRLQQSHLEVSLPVLDSKSCGVALDTVFASIFHLLSTAKRSSLCFAPAESAWNGGHLAHTLLSGLRTLLLFDEKTCPKNLESLRRRFDEFVQEQSFHHVDEFMIHTVCRAIIEELSTQQSTDAHGNLPRGFASLQISLDSAHTPEKLREVTTDFVQDALRPPLESSGWLQNYLTLYDLYWITESALIQQCLHMKRRNDLQKPSRECSNRTRLLLSARHIMQEQIFITLAMETQEDAQKAQRIKAQFGAFLYPGMASPCLQDQCSCAFEDKVIVVGLRSQHQQPLVRAYLTKFCFPDHITKELQSSLKNLEARLLSWYNPIGKGRFERATSNTGVTVSRHSSKIKVGTGQPKRQISKGGIELVRHEEEEVSSPEQRRAAFPHLQSDMDVREYPYSQTEPRTPSADVSNNLDSRRPRLTTRDRQPSFATSYDEVASVDFQNSSRPSNRSPLPSSSATSPHTHVVQMAQIEHESIPERFQLNGTSAMPVLITHENDFPEVVGMPNRAGIISPSIISEESEPSFSHVGQETKSRKWQSYFKTSRATNHAFTLPSAAFFASGKSLLIWNPHGVGCYDDFHNIESPRFRKINALNVSLAAGGTHKCAVVIKDVSQYHLKVFGGEFKDVLREWRLEGMPMAMALSRNDQYLGVKFPAIVLIYDISSGGSYRHELPTQRARSGRGNHLISFALDSQSFMASTRYEPEKVITYWSECTAPSRATSTQSIAPFGLLGDDGLSSLLCSTTASRAGFLTTFTEKGNPVLLSLSAPRPLTRLLRDNKGLIGSRIHRAALCGNGKNLVLVNQNNDVFWMLDPFGQSGHEATRVGSVKRLKSVKREVEIGMPNDDEVHIFWIDKGRGNVVTMGKSGGKSKPVDLMVDLESLQLLHR